MPFSTANQRESRFCEEGKAQKPYNRWFVAALKISTQVLEAFGLSPQGGKSGAAAKSSAGMDALLAIASLYLTHCFPFAV